MQSPKELNSTGKSIFRRIAKIVTVDDRNLHAVTILADLLARYREAQADLNANGLVFVSSQGVPRANPASNFILKVVPQIRALSGELGLYDTPDSGDNDPLAGFMEGE